MEKSPIVRPRSVSMLQHSHLKSHLLPRNKSRDHRQTQTHKQERVSWKRKTI